MTPPPETYPGPDEAYDDEPIPSPAPPSAEPLQPERSQSAEPGEPVPAPPGDEFPSSRPPQEPERPRNPLPLDDDQAAGGPLLMMPGDEVIQPPLQQPVRQTSARVISVRPASEYTARRWVPTQQR